MLTHARDPQGTNRRKPKFDKENSRGSRFTRTDDLTAAVVTQESLRSGESKTAPCYFRSQKQLNFGTGTTNRKDYPGQPAVVNFQQTVKTGESALEATV